MNANPLNHLMPNSMSNTLLSPLTGASNLLFPNALPATLGTNLLSPSNLGPPDLTASLGSIFQFSPALSSILNPSNNNNFGSTVNPTANDVFLTGLNPLNQPNAGVHFNASLYPSPMAFGDDASKVSNFNTGFNPNLLGPPLNWDQVSFI
jgi:hypothetical protein